MVTAIIKYKDNWCYEKIKEQSSEGEILKVETSHSAGNQGRIKKTRPVGWVQNHYEFLGIGAPLRLMGMSVTLLSRAFWKTASSIRKWDSTLSTDTWEIFRALNICHYCLLPNPGASRLKVTTQDSQTELLFGSEKKIKSLNEWHCTLLSVSLLFKILFQRSSRTEGPNLHDILEKHVAPGWGSGNSVLLRQRPAVMGHSNRQSFLN